MEKIFVILSFIFLSQVTLAESAFIGAVDTETMDVIETFQESGDNSKLLASSADPVITSQINFDKFNLKEIRQAYQEIDEEVILYEGSYLYRAITIPLKWADSVITEAITVLIPIKGVAAYNMDDVMKDVAEAIEGSAENVHKNKDAYIAGLEAAQAGMEQYGLMQAHIKNDPNIQKAIKEARETTESLTKEFQERNKKKFEQSQPNIDALKSFFEDSFKQNPDKLKEWFEAVIDSDLPKTIKEKALEALNLIKGGASNIDPTLFNTIAVETLRNGAAMYFLCDLIIAAGGFVVAGPPGAGAALVSGQSICSGLGAAEAVRGGIKAGLENMQFRKAAGEDSGGSVSVNQMQQQVQRGQAPKSVTRVESTGGLHEKDHVHFKDGSALNKDGTWKHGWRVSDEQ